MRERRRGACQGKEKTTATKNETRPLFEKEWEVTKIGKLFFFTHKLFSLSLGALASRPPAVSLSEPEPNLGIVPTIIKERKTKLQNYSSPAAAAAASLSLSASRAATAVEATDLLEPELGAPPPTAPFAARSRDPASAARSAGES